MAESRWFYDNPFGLGYRYNHNGRLVWLDEKQVAETLRLASSTADDRFFAWLDAAHTHEGRSTRRPQPTSSSPVDQDVSDEQPLAELLRSRLLSVQALQQLPAPEFLIDDVLPAASTAVVWGKPGASKSFLALDWSLSLATGSWWFGREVRQGPVLYVAAEGARGIDQRVGAWMKDRLVYEVDPDAFRLYPGAINLLDDRWAMALDGLVALLKPVLIVIDTLARCMVGGDENSARDMGRAIDAMDRMAKASGGTVVAVHHDRKDGASMRGSSALLGAVDTSIEVKADGQSVTISCDKQKDAAEFADIALWREPVADSCVLWERRRGRGSNTESESTLLEAMWQSAGSEGLTSTALQRVSELPERTFYRALKTLREQGVVRNVGSDARARWAPVEEE